jgi:hypothetical protein
MNECMNEVSETFLKILYAISIVSRELSQNGLWRKESQGTTGSVFHREADSGSRS